MRCTPVAVLCPWSDQMPDQKAAAAHDRFAVDPDVEVAAHAVDVRGGDPGLSGVLGDRVAEGDVDARDLLVLEDVAADVLEGDVGADGELADPVAVLVRGGV